MVVDHQLLNMIKKFICTIIFCLLTQASFAAGNDSSSDTNNYLDQYKAAKNLIIRGKKLETKGKNDKAIKLYNSAYKKLLMI